MSPHAPRAVLRLLPDEPLARLAAGGSEPAFNLLYARHAAGLTTYCRRVVRNDEDALDALQNTMLKAWSALARRGDAPLRPWLYRIAHNESVSLLRRRRRRDELHESATPTTDVHETVTEREELAAAITDIGTLTARQRQALLMRVLGEATYDDIAATLQTSPEAARQSVTSARRALRRRRVAGILPLPAWLAELCAMTSSGSSVLSGQVAGRAAAGLTAAVATVGVVHDKGTAARHPPTAHVRHRQVTAVTAASAPATTVTPSSPSVRLAAATGSTQRQRRLTTLRHVPSGADRPAAPTDIGDAPRSWTPPADEVLAERDSGASASPRSPDEHVLWSRTPDNPAGIREPGHGPPTVMPANVPPAADALPDAEPDLQDADVAPPSEQPEAVPDDPAAP
jgi:RNA polymerase sigma factor (sigma-70 family)